MIKQLLVISLFVLLAVASVMYFSQRNLIYYPSKSIPDRKTYHAEDMEPLRLRTPDGIDLKAWYKPARDNKPTILYLHGNAGHIGNRMPLARQLLDAGFGVLLLEYRGYGGNQGKPTEGGLYTDGRTALHFLWGKNISPRHLALYGESLGTGVATKLATEFPVCAVVLQSPYTSLPAVARYHYPWVLIETWDKFDSLSRIAKINGALLILHGKQDSLVPFAEGVALYKQAKEPKQLLALANKGHDNAWGSQLYTEVIRFIRSHCI